MASSHFPRPRITWANSVDQETVVFCRQTQQGFLRLATNAKALGEYSLTMKRAWNLYDEIGKDHRIAFDDEPEGIESVWKTFTSRQTKSPKFWNDA